MASILMCKNEKCLQKEKCHRYTAVPFKHQVYSEFKPDKNGKCDAFIYALKKKK